MITWKINSKFWHFLHCKVVTIGTNLLHLLGLLRLSHEVTLCYYNPHVFLVTFKITTTPLIEINI